MGVDKMILSRLLDFFKRGLFGGWREEEFIKRIKKGDVDYILNIGVPSIEPPATPGTKPWKVPFIAEGVDIGSLMLVDPEAMMYILLSTEETYDIVRGSGSGSRILEIVANYTALRPGIYYFDSVPDSNTELRLLAVGGYVTGIYYEHKGRTFIGPQAWEAVAAEKWDGITFTVTRVKEKLLEWSDKELSVYVVGLDNQHKYLVNTLNSLYYATIRGEAERVASTILKRLVDYTKFHFKSEEILMEKYNYPHEKYAKHVREHKAFVKATADFKEKYEKGEEELTLKVFKFLATWVKNHVAGTDRDYGRYFVKIGIANINTSPNDQELLRI